MSKTGEDTLAFEYDANGIRTSKTVNSTVTTFTVIGGQITRQQTGENSIYFFYDNDGQLIGLNYADVNYFYVKNLQGDIVAIAGIDGSIVVEYTYDAWGNILSTTGTLVGTLGNDNPFRYRGYYYDAEVELYYLQSRYYSPEWGRFINADGTDYLGFSVGQVLTSNDSTYRASNSMYRIDTTGFLVNDILLRIERKAITGYVGSVILYSGFRLIGTNLFSYCENRPVMFVDVTGKVAVVAIIGAVIAAGGSAYAMGKALGRRLYYAGYKNSWYQKNKWYVRYIIMTSLGPIAGPIFLTGFENEYYSLVVGR